LFTADIWFSTYNEGGTPKVAAIIADVTEENDDELSGTTEPPPAAIHENQERVPALNARETEVLRLLVQGLANKEIAARMDVSESTVKNTIQQLFAKTGVRTRSQLVRVALEQYRNIL
jgi:DNA-binding NarL/FixJ family response regulator